MSRAPVITYQLAYLSHHYVSLCRACADRHERDFGALGPVSLGAHWGYCESPRHAAQPAAPVRCEVRS